MTYGGRAKLLFKYQGNILVHSKENPKIVYIHHFESNMTLKDYFTP